ncbi:YesL family protein [Alkalihalobacillus sp. LMS39]|uniref:YesL family protein n=1 Tax=Alkalihalobacillus sp. LMS39 TaxID=2924032 RepID=UPI001FB26240|nr:YesL family protein [Alkalihalobacillus sp. LMS39]UOE94951.1 YesL family protein [Alkalihalobacillus sp. LMS39]
MNFSGFTTVVNECCEWLMKLAFLNTLWVVFSVLGLGIFGWAPATAAVFAVLRKRLTSNDEFKMLPFFWSVYKKEFFKANLIGVFLVFGSWSFYFSLSTLLYLPQAAMITVGTVFFIALILYLIVSLFIFPVFTHYDTNLRTCFRYALMIGLANLHYCLIIGVCLGIIAVLFHAFPGILLFYSISLPVWCIIAISLKVFTNMESFEQNVEENSYTYN